MKADRKRLKGEKTDLVSQMQQLYATLESREEQLRDFIRNYEQHRKVRPRPARHRPRRAPPPRSRSDRASQNTDARLASPRSRLGSPPTRPPGPAWAQPLVGGPPWPLGKQAWPGERSR